MPSNRNDMEETKKLRLKRAKVSKIENMKKKKTGKKDRRKLKKVLKICLFVFIGLVVVGIGVVLGVLNSVLSGTEELDYSQLKNLKLTTTVLDKDGKQIGTISSGENRLLANYEDLPKYLVDAVVSIEDERFWVHNGVDIKRTGAAIVTYVLHRGNSSFGDSTITQQLVKNITEDNETSWKRKIREWYRAFEMERELKKEEILEAYLNKIYFGEGANGVEMAAQTFFAKSAKDVNLAEAACLAASIQTPEGSNPYNGDEAKQRLIERQKVVLDKMLSLGKITEEEYNTAINTELTFKKGSLATSSAVQSYARDAVWEAVAKDLASKKNITYDAALDMVASSGYVIYSTIDSDVQKEVDNQANNSKLFYKDKKRNYDAMCNDST